MSFKSGFVTVIGRPNVGKSTMINAITGEKVSIVSEKPQTTRNVVKAIVTRQDAQIVFIDTPGVHKPKNKLGEYMVNVAHATLNEVDAVVFITQANDKEPGEGDKMIISQLKAVRTPAILVINKIDLVKKEELLSMIAAYNELMNFAATVPVSAIQGEGIDLVIKEILKLLPEGPKYFPDDMVTDQSERILAAEIIREKMLSLLEDEVPHGIGVDIETFKERQDKNIIDIDAVIYCEKESHKGIIIGKQGSMLKKIGTIARVELENILGTKIFLQLWVKVKPDWRNSESILRMLGYK